jgi:hypothetical protein
MKLRKVKDFKEKGLKNQIGLLILKDLEIQLIKYLSKLIKYQIFKIKMQKFISIHLIFIKI